MQWNGPFSWNRLHYFLELYLLNGPNRSTWVSLVFQGMFSFWSLPPYTTTFGPDLRLPVLRPKLLLFPVLGTLDPPEIFGRFPPLM